MIKRRLLPRILIMGLWINSTQMLIDHWPSRDVSAAALANPEKTAQKTANTKKTTKPPMAKKRGRKQREDPAEKERADQLVGEAIVQVVKETQEAGHSQKNRSLELIRMMEQAARAANPHRPPQPIPAPLPPKNDPKMMVVSR